MPERFCLGLIVHRCDRQAIIDNVEELAKY